MATNTPNYNFTLPTEGADNDAWGGMLNGNWSITDTQLKSVSDVADQASSKATEADGKADANTIAIEGNDADIASNTAAISANSAALNDKLDLAGGTMTGILELAADPAADNQASNKKYVDETVAAAVAAAITPDYDSGWLSTWALPYTQPHGLGEAPLRYEFILRMKSGNAAGYPTGVIMAGTPHDDGDGARRSASYADATNVWRRGTFNMDRFNGSAVTLVDDTQADLRILCWLG